MWNYFNFFSRVSENFTVGDAKNFQLENFLFASCSIVAVNQYQFQSVNAYLSMFFVKVQFPFKIHQMMMMVMMIHHWIRIEHELNVDSSCKEWNFCMTFTTSILEADFSLFLWSITESCESDLLKVGINFWKWLKIQSVTRNFGNKSR